MSEKTTVYSFVISKIAALEKDTPWSKAMLAKLRRGIGKHPGATPEIWAITLADAPEEWHSSRLNPSREENAVHAALTLYALHRQGKDHSMSVSGKTDKGINVGDSIGGATARLIKPDNSNLDAVKRRFDVMATATDFLELAYHAKGIIQLLNNDDKKLDYPRFASELYAYQIPGRADGIRLRWGEDFYRVLYAINQKGNENEKEN